MRSQRLPYHRKQASRKAEQIRSEIAVKASLLTTLKSARAQPPETTRTQNAHRIRSRTGVQRLKSGGGSGIRTRDTVSRIHTFQACAFNHSATPPYSFRICALNQGHPSVFISDLRPQPGTPLRIQTGCAPSTGDTPPYSNQMCALNRGRPSVFKPDVRPQPGHPSAGARTIVRQGSGARTDRDFSGLSGQPLDIPVTAP